MRRFHKPGDEKRSVAVVSPEHYRDWLYADEVEARALLRPFTAEEFRAHPAPRPIAQEPGISRTPDSDMP